MNHKPPHRFKSTVLLLCFLLLLPILSGCSALSSLYQPTTTPTAIATQTLTVSPTATELPALCGGPRVMYILLIGSDSRSSGYVAGLADAIRVVRVDFTRPRVQLLSFPRDLYVEIPGIESHHGITHGKLNQAFLYGNPGFGYYDGPGQGPGLLNETLEHNFDIHADHYLAVNLQAFSKIIDTLGGIDIHLPYVVDGRVKHSKDPNRYFPAGDQHLNGYRTMLLARMRPQGDLQRSEIQNIILQAVAQKLLSPAVISQLPQLVEVFRGSVQADFDPVTAGQLVCLAARLDTKKIEFASFPDSLFQSARVQDPVLGNTSIMKADFTVLKSYVQVFKEGMWFEKNRNAKDNQ
jgi:polyisoprenyl-teichoic acid--peptidoglycan teichoic acid transferase